jgi:L-malate glycosyltransferase
VVSSVDEPSGTVHYALNEIPLRCFTSKIPYIVQPTLLIVQRHLPHYRVAFFEALRDALNQRGVTLRLAHGSPTASEATKNDGGRLSWAEHLPTRYWWGEKVCWLPYGSLMRSVQMVVVTSENKLIYNLLPQFFNRSVRFAWWGHGRNMKGQEYTLRERFKRWSAQHADWWFAYTEQGRDLVLKGGFPAGHISVLNNSVDTRSMVFMRAAVTPEMQIRLRHEIGLQGSNVGVYVGSLYTEKRIKFMLDAVVKVREQVPDFEFLMVGAGPHTPLVAAFCRQYPWAHALGARRGADMVAAVSLARVMVNPGAVGLTMVDSFACEVPLFTTDCGVHGPEIDYLVNHQNGVMTENSVDVFARAVARGLQDREFWTRLHEGCVQSAQRYTMEGMVEQFVAGVMLCLQQPVRRHRVSLRLRPQTAV